MDFTNTVISELKRKNEYMHGDVLFSKDDGGVAMRFYKKEDLPWDLLPGISRELRRKTKLPDIRPERLTCGPVALKEEDATSFTFFCRGETAPCVDALLNCCRKIRERYDTSASHVTRMFGSYVLLRKTDGRLKAVYATPPPIRYCPLMVSLLKEVGGETADRLLTALKNGEAKTYQKQLLSLINDVVIAGGGFDDDRPLNSCERNVLFGASEIMSDAMEQGVIDASVIVSNNLGTVVTSSPGTTQGVVRRMTGLFYTTASPAATKNAFAEGIVPVFPFTGKIDQVGGLKHAVGMGYKNISVSVAAGDNSRLAELAGLERDDLTIYRFGLCATGISDETAISMAEHADIVWSCASKPVREIVAPKALLQIGIKIPVFILSRRGWELVKPRIRAIDSAFDLDAVRLNSGEEMMILHNGPSGLSLMKRKELDDTCVDCPSPCI